MASHSVGGMGLEAEPDFEEEFELLAETEFGFDANRSDPLMAAMRPQTTGRFLVTFDEDASSADRFAIMADIVAHRASAEKMVLTDLDGLARARGSDSNKIRFAGIDRFGFAVMDAPKTVAPMAMLEAIAKRDGIVSARPEYYVYAFDYVEDTVEATWGLHATGADQSPYTGLGIKVAVLDPGIQSLHLDFKERDIQVRSFVSGEDHVDVRGHGTHCAGTIAGPRLRERSHAGVGYGCAPDVSLFVGKVMNGSGVGVEAEIFAGIDWALDQRCEIVSMSFGRAVQPGTGPDPVYERLGSQALDEGCLLIAAAGNDSHRSTDFVAPVGIPGNSQSILAVGAIDMDMSIAGFSNGGINVGASGIDLVAPGVRVLSSHSLHVPYQMMSGTSMACPHVAGVAALWAESDSRYRGRELRRVLHDNARALPGSAGDFGAGLVQAPKRSVLAV